MKKNYDALEAGEYTADAHCVKGWRGVAWHILGWETEPDSDTEWSGVENRTGRLVARMVGDDKHFSFDPQDVTPIEREEYCGACGQIGCGWC
jgi:DMSO/TMAO reductase YedYZ molybdopterin-dependent catalytic subunit